jgi:pSer/pThr/pTyr-binding forkhead associated (FHA) protein
MKLEVTIGQLSTEVPVTEGDMLIGRSDPAQGINPAVDLRFDDAVSRRHAKITTRGGSPFLVDLGSTNGTKLNGQWIEPNREVPITVGDRIEMGAVTTITVLEAT